MRCNVNKQIELEKLDRVIKDGEIRLRTVNINIMSLSKEIDQLEQAQSLLIDNIHFLKKNKVVAMAGEYKKARDDLARTTIRIITLSNDRETFKKAAERVQTGMEEAREMIEKLKRNGDSNVIIGHFGSRDGQK